MTENDSNKLKIIVENKGENKMEILKIWKERNLEKLNEETYLKAKLIKNEDKINQEIQKFKEKILEKYGVGLQLGLNEIAHTKETIEKIDELYRKSDVERKRIEQIYNEVEAQLEICETYEQKREILIKYKIIDENTTQIIV